MGVVMRLYPVIESLKFVNYKFLQHAHSHVALLGWVYIGVVTMIYHVFLKNSGKGKLYKRIFLMTNISVIGMMIAFPIQGYALVSITFSTLFLFASYWFAWFAMKYIPEEFKSRFSWKLIRTSLWYLVISSIGPWGIGAVMSTLGPESIWYKSSIYFYLHFQYNAWFIMALLGLLFFVLEERGIRLNVSLLKSFYSLLNLGVILSLFLSVLWFKPPLIFYILGAIGAVAQGLAFYELYLLWKPYIPLVRRKISLHSRLLLRLAACLMGFKLYMQLMSAIPYYADLAYKLKDFVIGYLHLVFLGIIIPLMLVLLKHFKLIRWTKGFLYLFYVTFAITEILIFYKAFALWLKFPLTLEYYHILAYFSCLFPIAVGILLINNISAAKSSDS